MAHWYTQQGLPCHTLEGKNGRERPTTLADAKKLNLFPSVSEFIGQMNKPALTKWLQKEAVKATIELVDADRPGDEPTDSFINRCLMVAGENTSQARDKGTLIHKALEDYYNGNKGIVPADYLPHVMAGMNRLHEACPEAPHGWLLETPFACEAGYGGTIDLRHATLPLMGDWKTTKTELGKPVVAYDDHIMQLAAYRRGRGLPHARLFNIFISTTEPGRADLVWHSPKDIERAEKMFDCLLTLWQIDKGWRPSWR